MSPSEIPRTFGRYEVLRLLGRGAVGEVYLARDPVLGREVAVKTLSGLAALPVKDQEEARARFLREARAAAVLSHPNIVTIHDVGQLDGTPFIAMEYLKGTSLDHYVKPGHLLPVVKVLEIGVAAAAALEEAHRKGMVHRDIKPANLVLLDDGTLKVADFGLAKGVESSLTAADTLLGTPNYMSPEQVSGKPLDGRSDLFSLAVSLFELLAGQRPFGGDTVASVLYRIVNDAPTPLLKLRADLPAELGPFFEKVLAKDPDHRLANGGEFAGALAEMLKKMGGVPANLRLPPPASLSGPVSRPAAGSTTAKERKRSTVTTMVIGGLLLLATAVALLFTPLGTIVGLGGGDKTVLVETDPPNLTVKVSGGEARMTEPGKLLVSKGSKAPVVLEAGDECRSGSVTLEPGRIPDRVRLAASAKELEVKISTQPAGAEVTVNGEPQPGTTPLAVKFSACESYSVEFRAAGRESVSVALGAKEPVSSWQRKLNSVLLPPGRADQSQQTAEAAPREGKVVFSASPGYPVEIRLAASGRKLGPAGKTYSLPAGSQAVLLVNDEILLRRTVTIQVPVGGTADSGINWPGVGFLTVFAVPPGGRVIARGPGAERGVEIGTTPINHLSLVEGEYSLEIEHPDGGKRATATASVRSQDETTVKVTQKEWR